MKNNYASYKNKKFSKKRRFNYKSSNESDGTKALKLAKTALRLVKPEFKRFYSGPNVGTYSYAGYLSGPIVTPGQGPGFSERIGNMIFIKSITFIFCLTQAGSNEEFNRICIVNDKGNKYTNPIDVFEGLGTNEAPMTFQTQTHLRNVDVLWDKLIHITNQNPLVNFMFTLPINKRCELSGAGSVTPITNAIKLFTCNQSSTTGTEFSFHTECHYSDV